MSFAAKTCAPAQKGLAPFSREQAETHLAEIPGWEISDDGLWLQRKFSFKNFVEALAFVNKAGVIAEEQGHHPDFMLGWGYAHIKLQTHDVGGLHDNDFIMAAKINAIS